MNQALYEFLARIDLSEPPGSTFEDLRAILERHLSPGWIAFFYEGEDSTERGFHRSATSQSFLSILSGASPGVWRYPEAADGEVCSFAPSECVTHIAELAGVPSERFQRFFDRNGTSLIHHYPVQRTDQLIGHLLLGETDQAVPPEAIEQASTVLGHLYYVFDLVARIRTRSSAFEALGVPSLVCSEDGRIQESNDAFKRLFGNAENGGRRVTELFKLTSGEPTERMLRKEHVAHPAVAALPSTGREVSGVLHSLAGATSPANVSLRYLYFVPDGAAMAVVDAPALVERRYPRLALPQELSLTAREIDVATRIAAGESSKEMARRLNISIRTVQFHRQSLRDKLKIVGRGLSLRHALLEYERPEE